MKLDDDLDVPEGFFVHHAALKTLERQLYAHVRELGDLRNLTGLEQVVYEAISDELDEQLALDLTAGSW